MDQLSLLRLFVGIAESGSLSAAARQRGMSPSTVTLGLQRLEERVGARLVNRSTRRLALTQEGERFLAACRRILADVDETMNGVAEDGPLMGDIRISAANDFGRSQLAALLDDFLRLHPRLRIELVLSDTVVDLVEDGYDLALRIGPMADSSLVARVLMHGPRHVCAAPSYWARRGKPAHPRELAEHNCLVLARPGSPQHIWGFRDGEREFSVRVAGDRSSNDGGLLRDWAVAGHGVALKFAFNIEADLAAGRLETALEDYVPPGVSLYAVRPAGAYPARRIQVLLDYLQARLAEAGAAGVAPATADQTR